MASYRMGRITEDIKRELSEILRKVKDPRVKDKFISIVRVEVTNDLSYAKVFISSIEGMGSANVAVEGLKSASGFVRSELGRRLKLRHIPNIIFQATDSIEYSASISKMLSKL